MTFNIDAFLLGVSIGAGGHALGQLIAVWWMSRPQRVKWPRHYRAICECMRGRAHE